MKREILIYLLLMTLAAPAAAQTAYVSDRLFLGLYPEADSNGTPIKSMASGTQVEILETRDTYVRVRLGDGTEGWARADFVTQETPAKLLLDQMKIERDRLRQQLSAGSTADGQQLEAMQAQLVRAQQTINELQLQLGNSQHQNTDAQAAEGRYQQAQQTITQLKQELAEQGGERKPPANLAVKILWLLFAISFSTALGAALGVRWLGARIRRRFNGLKIW
jgi:SH3 domain protein